MGKCSLDVTQLLLNNNQSVVKSAKIETELFLETLQSVRLGSLEKSSKMFKRIFLKGLIGHHLVYLMNLSKGKRAAIFHGKVNDYPKDPIYSLCSIFQCVYLLLAQIFIVNQGLTQRPPG